MNPIFLDLGIVQIHWYSFILFLAFFLSGSLAILEGEKWNIPKDFMINLFFYIVIFGLVGARFWYVIFNWDYYSVNISSIIKVWEGALAIHGGILFSLLFTIFYARKYKIRVLRLLDILVVSLFLGQAIGRWGNFMNGEAHGAVTSLAHLQSMHLPQFIIDGMYIDGNYYIPTFLYESIFCFIGFIVLLIFRHLKYTKIGQTTALYLIMYGIERFIVEGMRTDSLMISNFKVAQVISVIFVLSGIYVFIKSRHGSVFSDRYNDDQNKEHTFF